MSGHSVGQYRRTAKRLTLGDAIEVDANAVVSRGDDDGAYVAAWIWVDDYEVAESMTRPVRYDDLSERQRQWLGVYLTCSAWHSGQWSRGYRLLCRAQKLLGREFGPEWHRFLPFVNEQAESPEATAFERFKDDL